MSNRCTFSDADAYIPSMKIDNNIHYDSVILSHYDIFLEFYFHLLLDENFLFSIKQMDGFSNQLAPLLADEEFLSVP
jgi:hypothetical protein